MTTADLQNISNFLNSDNYVSIRDIQKSPTKVLHGIKIVMNGSKPQGIYIDNDIYQEWLEDQEMINSKTYKQKIAESRKSELVSASEVWGNL